MYLSVIFIVKKALHISVASSQVDFTSWVVGCCCSHCKDYSRESCADHGWGDSRGGVSSVTGENPGNVEGALASQGATRAQRAVVGKRRGSWLDASPLAPPLPRTPAAEDRVRGSAGTPGLLTSGRGTPLAIFPCLP